MYNYHADIVWVLDSALCAVVIITIAVILICVIFKDYLWLRRRRGLLSIKKNVFEMVLAGKKASAAVCLPFTADITPQQFIDIETNRNIEVAFFNDSERQFFKNCFITSEQIAKLKNIAATSRNKWLRIEAVLSLGYTQSEEAVDILKDTLLNKDKDIVYFSIISLGQIKTVLSAKALLRFLQKDPSESYKIISVLENFPKEITDEVIKLTDYHDPLVRFWATTLLSKFPQPQYLKGLEKLTHDQSPDVRGAACDCIGNIGNKDAKETLLNCLKDDSWLVKTHAILALSKVLGAAAVPEVVGLISDASWLVLDSIKEVMAAHIETSLPYIEKFLAGTNEIAKKYSVLALQDSGYIVKLLDNVVSGANKDTAVRLLKGIIKSKVHAALDSAVNSLDPARRAQVVEALVKIGQV